MARGGPFPSSAHPPMSSTGSLISFAYIYSDNVAGRTDGPMQLPVGFEQFHRQTFFNYQFNRAYGLGLADRNDLYNAGSRVRSAADCVNVFETLSRRAATDGQDRHAAGYMRLAEFFTPPQSPAKIERYRHFRALFDHAFVGDGMTRHPVPYAGAALPASHCVRPNRRVVARYSCTVASTR